MSTKTKFGNKEYQLPTTESRIISGQNNPPRSLDYGKLLIIDDNNQTEKMLGGSGIAGTNKQGKDAIYHFTDIKEFRDFCPYGRYWKAAEFLFNPDGKGNGISEVMVVKPATTVPATMSFTTASNGVFSFSTLDESEGANGVINETRAVSTYTITTAGAAADKHVLKVNGVTIASYTVVLSDTAAEVATGLQASLTTIGICGYVSKTTAAVTFSAPVGFGATTITPTNSNTGAAAGTHVPFAAGVTATNIYTGYGYTIETGKLDSSKWVMKVWRGSYRGLHTDSLSYDEISNVNSTPTLIAVSPEFVNIQTLIDWATIDQSFGSYFVKNTGCVAGAVVSGDVTNKPSYIPATGGSATYNVMDDTLEAILDLDYNYVMYNFETGSGTVDPTSEVNVLKILTHLETEAKYDKFFILAGSDTNVDTSITYAAGFNTTKVNLVHGGFKKKSQAIATGFRVWNSFYHTAIKVGRLLGLAPEVPLTNKSHYIDGLTQILSIKDQTKLDAAGVLCTIFDQDRNFYQDLHDVNTLQEADYILNNDGSSHLIQIERIKSQLNKELMINSKLDLMSDPLGTNRNSLTKTDAIEWTKGYLQRRLGTLIVAYQNVTASVVGDVIFVDYEAEPNTEIKSMFFTGRLYL